MSHGGAYDEQSGRKAPLSTLAEFLFPAPAPRTTGAILAWWERRRVAYNLMVGAAGSVSLVSFWVVTAVLGEGPQVLGSLLFAAAFGGMANVCYLLGPATELLLERVWGRRVLPAGPTLYRMGLTFSVGLALLPTLVLTIVLVVSTVATVVGLG